MTCTSGIWKSMGATRRIQRSVIVMSSFLSGRGLIIDRITGKIGHFATHAAIIHIDIDSASISRNIEVDIPIVADAKTALLALLEKAQKLDTQEWLGQIRQWQEMFF